MGKMVVLLLGVMIGAIVGTAHADICLVVATVDATQSPFTATGEVTAPVPGFMKTLKMNATGSVFLRLPSGSDPKSPCPKVTAENAQELFSQADLFLPVSELGFSFRPANFRSKVYLDKNDEASAYASFNLNKFSIGLDGNEPFGTAAVVVGKGTTAEAKSAQQPLCTEDIMTGGVLELDSQLVGMRNASLKGVAKNITAAAGISIEKTATGVGKLVISLDRLNTGFDIDPSKTPGVTSTTATYNITGKAVAVADLAKPATFRVLPAASKGWKSQPRMDGQPVVLGGEEKKPKAKYVVENGGGCTPRPLSEKAAPVAANGLALPTEARASSPDPQSQGSSASQAMGAALASAMAAAVALAIM
jgi:hypothetical protein